MGVTAHLVGELLKKRALAGGDDLGHFDSDRHELVALAVAAERLQAFAAQAEYLAGLGAGGQLHGHLALEGRYLELGAEGRLGKAHGDLADQIRALAFEKWVWLHLDVHVQVTGAVGCLVASSANCTHGTVFDTCWDAHEQALIGATGSMAVACLAARTWTYSGAVTRTAGSCGGEESTLKTHRAFAIACGAVWMLGIGIGAAALTAGADLVPSVVDALFYAQCRFFEAYRKVVA